MEMMEDIASFAMTFDLWVVARWTCYTVGAAIVLPWLIYVVPFIVFPVVFAKVYRWLYRIPDEAAVPSNYWTTAHWCVTCVWNLFGKVWHSYEIVNLERIPKDGAAVLVFYHSLMPVEIGFFISKLFFRDKRLPFTITERMMSTIPGMKLTCEFLHFGSGTVDEGIKLMKAGELLLVSPGGTREAAFSDQWYGLIWRKRSGFARIALQAGVPIIPLFTQNGQENGRCLPIFTPWFKREYERTRAPPLRPMIGGFPVKLTTYVGEPIFPKKGQTVEELVDKSRAAMEDLIHQHQRIPGSIWSALLQRII